MSQDSHPQPTASASGLYVPANESTDARGPAPGAGVARRPNPVGVAALIAAASLVVAQFVFQLVIMNTMLAGESLNLSVVVLVQPIVMGVLAVVTVVLGTIASLLRGRVRLAAGIGLGAGLYAFVSILIGVVMGMVF